MYYFKRRDNSGVSRIFWHCLCDCGNEIDVSNSGFYGNTKSCGCLKRESAIANGKNNLGRRYSEKKPRKNNEFDISGDYGIGYTIKRVSFYFDIDDYDLIKNYCWFMDNKGYIRAKSRNKNKKDYHMLHRLVMNITDPKVHINHKNGIRHDNRKANLRIAIEDGINKNSINRRIQKNNKSGYTGVKWHSRNSIWEVKIGYNNESHYLGRFNGYDEAVKARKKAEDKMFGKWSYKNSGRSDEIVDLHFREDGVR